MRSARLFRLHTTDAGTFGTLETDRGLKLFTGELPWRNNARARSSIPQGKYRCKWSNSPRFGECYKLENVPGRSEILIHAGNFCGDVTKGFASDVEGCVLLGMSVGELLRADGKLQLGVRESKKALRALESALRHEPFELNVSDRLLA